MVAKQVVTRMARASSGLNGESNLAELGMIARVGKAESFLRAIGWENLVGVVEEVLE